MAHSLGPFCIVATRPYSPLFEKHGIHDVASTDRATKASHIKRSDAASHHRQKTETNSKTHQQFTKYELGTEKIELTRHGNRTPEYTAEKIV